MKHFRVRYKTCTMNLGGFDPEDSWSRDSTSQHHEILGIEEVPEGGYSDLVADDEGPYYLLYVIYNTGDSFGRDDGQIEFVFLHTNQCMGYKNITRINEHYQTDGGMYYGNKDYAKFSVCLLDDNGEEFKLHVPWTGFFEDLVDVELVEVKVFN